MLTSVEKENFGAHTHPQVPGSIGDSGVPMNSYSDVGYSEGKRLNQKHCCQSNRQYCHGAQVRTLATVKIARAMAKLRERERRW